MQYDLIIFDWDGTLSDSISIISLALRESFEAVGLEMPSEEIAREVIGLGLQDAIKGMRNGKEDQFSPFIMEEYRKRWHAHSDSVHLFDGARQMIQNLHSSGRTLAIATGKSRRGIDRSLEVSAMKLFFSSTKTPDETLPKPNPDMILEILQELNVKPEKTVMIGDTTHDLQMAKSAGVDAVAVTYGAHSADRLKSIPYKFKANNINQVESFLLNTNSM